MYTQTGDIAEAGETDEIAPVETDKNFSVQRVATGLAGAILDGMRITFGAPPRSMTVRDLGLLDQFDLVEVAGERTTNATWMAMAGLAWATTEIDGVPVSRPSKLVQIRAVLERIKPDGLAAYFKALRTPQKADGEIVEIAKN